MGWWAPSCLAFSSLALLPRGSDDARAEEGGDLEWRRCRPAACTENQDVLAGLELRAG